MPQEQEAVARAAASAIVGAELRGVIGYVSGDTARLFSDEYGNVRLPRIPVRAVTGIRFDSGQAMSMDNLVVDGYLIQGLPAGAWLTVTYDHGWREEDVPDIVRTIVDSLTRRILSNPDDALRAEAIGSYRVDYDPDARWLTDSEKQALQQHMRVLAGMSATTSTMSPPAPAAAFGGWE